MVAIRTDDGIVQIRYTSSETKPEKHSKINAFDHYAQSVIKLEVTEGSEAFEMDTGKVFMLNLNGWGEI